MLLRGKYKNLPEDPDSIPASTWLVTTGYNSSSKGFDALLLPLHTQSMHMVLMHIHAE